MEVTNERVQAVATAVDQGLAGITNTLTVVAAARLVDGDLFGMFASIYTVGAIWLAVSRTFFVEGPLVASRSAGASRDTAVSQMTRGSIEAAGITAIVAVALALVFAQVGIATSVAVGLSFAAVVLHESRRYALVQSGGALRAVVSEVVWLLSLIAALGFAGPLQTMTDVLLLWLLPGVAAALVLIPSPRLLTAVIHTDMGQRTVGVSISAETLLALATTAFPISLSALIVSPVVAGQLRLVQSLIAAPSMLVDVVRKRLTLSLGAVGSISLRRSTLILLGFATGVGIPMLVALGSASQSLVDAPMPGQLWISLPLVIAFGARAAGTPALVHLRLAGRASSTVLLRAWALGPVAAGLLAGSVSGRGWPVAVGICGAALTANVGAYVMAVDNRPARPAPTSVGVLQ